MNKKDFKTYMQQGRGACALVLQSEKNIEKYKDVVLWGCLHNLSYDTQCEGVRAEYVYNLTTYFGDDEYFVAPIIRAFTSLSNNKDDLFQHLCTQLSLFAKSGNADAKIALLQKYEQLYDTLLHKHSFKAYDFERDNFQHFCIILLPSCNEDFICKMMRDLGHLFKENPHYDGDEFDWLCFSIEKHLGKRKFDQILKRDSQRCEDVKCFYENYLPLIKKREKNRKRIPHKPEAPSVESIIEEIATTGRLLPHTRVRFYRYADATARKQLAQVLVAEENFDKKAELLSVFFHHEFPLPHEIVVEYANSSHERLREVALTALTNCQSKAVYDYALELFQKYPSSTTALEMLLQNYTVSIKELLLRALYSLEVDYESESDWHSIDFKIRDLFESGKKLPKEFLLYVYNTSLCSCCRHQTVRILAKHRWLTKEMIEECRFDSNDRIVKYINRYYPQK